MTQAERRLCEWQLGGGGDFVNKLFALASCCDNNNLARLGEGFPEEVSCYRKYRDEKGYWPQLMERWAKGER